MRQFDEKEKCVEIKQINKRMTRLDFYKKVAEFGVTLDQVSIKIGPIERYEEGLISFTYMFDNNVWVMMEADSDLMCMVETVFTNEEEAYGALYEKYVEKLPEKIQKDKKLSHMH